MENGTLRYYSKILNGTERAELVLRNARLVNVISDEVKKSDIAISNGMIVGVGDYFRGKKEINLMGKFVCPGFINAYADTKSAGTIIRDYDRQALSDGTTAYVFDLSNADNIERYIAQTENLTGNALFLLPMSYALDKEYSNIREKTNIIGFTIYPDDIKVLLNDGESILKLSHINGKLLYVCMDDFSEEILKIISILGNVIVKGCTSFDELISCVRLGCGVLIDDEYSDELIRGTIRNYLPQNNLMLCADCKNGYAVGYNIKRAVMSGLNPVYATKMASYNTANKLGLSYFGTVAPGKQADLVILNDLTSVDIDTVLVKGKPIS